MKVGIGYLNSSAAYDAGRTIAKKAIAKDDIQQPDVVLAFCHARMNHTEFFRGLRSVVGEDVPIIGGSAIGIITNEDLSYRGCPAGAVVLSSPQLTCRWACAGDLDRDEKAAGKTLGKRIKSNPQDLLLLLFYDSIKVPPTKSAPLVMNASRHIIKGIEKGLQKEKLIIGAGLMGHVDFRSTEQFCGDQVGSQKAVGLMLAGDYCIYNCVMHGCGLLDGEYHTITGIEGARIYELDGRPIVPIIDEIYGDRQWQQQKPLKRLAIGVNHGNPFDEFKEENYVNRLISGVLPNKDGVMMFEPDLEDGTRIQFMLRDSQEMIRSARLNAQKLMAQIAADKKQPLFGLYIDCAGRAAALSDTMTEEAAEVVEVFNRYKTPLLGFYSGVEVAPLLGKSRGLDWTGVLAVIAR